MTDLSSCSWDLITYSLSFSSLHPTCFVDWRPGDRENGMTALPSDVLGCLWEARGHFRRLE